MTATYTITRNEQFNSLEISFASKPSAEIREALKALRFRWHGQKKVWYGYADEDAAKAAITGEKAAAPAPVAKKAKAEKQNKFGVTVGDLFYSSWGYEQTNVDFFQVVELIGETSVRVVEVNPPMIAEQGVSPMSADRLYKNTKELLPHSSSSVFIKDQEKGDIKRLKSYSKDGKHPQFYLTSYANAYIVEGDSIKLYESWYY
jgi:hypothetical protein